MIVVPTSPLVPPYRLGHRFSNIISFMRTTWLLPLAVLLPMHSVAQVRPVSPVVTNLVLQAPPAKKVVGTWALVMPNGVKADAMFKPDGSLFIEAKNPAAPAMLIDITGKYHTDGNKIYMKFLDVMFKNTPASAKAQEGQMRDGLKKQIGVGQDKVATISWLNANSFKTDNNGKISTYVRKH